MYGEPDGLTPKVDFQNKKSRNKLYEYKYRFVLSKRFNTFSG